MNEFAMKQLGEMLTNMNTVSTYSSRLCYGLKQKKYKYTMLRREYIGGCVYDVDVIVKVKKIGGNYGDME